MESTSTRSGDSSQSGVDTLLAQMKRSVPTDMSSWTVRVGAVRRRFGPLLGALTLGVGLLGGCAKKTSQPAPPEVPSADWDGASGGGGDGDEESSVEEVEELERRLGAEESQLRAAGVALPRRRGLNADASSQAELGFDEAEAEASRSTPQEEPSVSGSEAEPAAEEMESVADVDRGDRGRCTNICAISRSICDLEAQICSLAERHVDERRYSEVCERASADCRVAQEACNACA